ncbi:hypothetical protein [Streptomyces sp. NPDC094032]|uniref:hypothetical protein n=1 Tax=Streptomyces sp. NPDC094032 TaxID=3155308 RepID=UPI003332AAF5
MTSTAGRTGCAGSARWTTGVLGTGEGPTAESPLTGSAAGATLVLGARWTEAVDAAVSCARGVVGAVPVVGTAGRTGSVARGAEAGTSAGVPEARCAVPAARRAAIAAAPGGAAFAVAR